MQKRIGIAALVVLAAGALAAWRLTGGRGPAYYTGFVEGEERVIRAEVSGRVLEVGFAEGDAVPAGAVLARVDDGDIRTERAAKRQEVAVLDAEIERQEEQVRLIESTWGRDVATRRAELAQAEAGAALAEKTYAREQDLVRSGASTAQLLDDVRARRDEARSGLARARELLARAEAEERQIAVARRQLEVLHERRGLARAELARLDVTAAKHEVRAPDVPTVVQTRYVWPGELAQPGTPIVALLDPRDKYVQVYVPVAEVERFTLGRRVEVELDSQPGRRFPGEVSFVADEANFTPEKIETRGDRLGQVYRAKVRVLEGVEALQPGTEGNVYLVEAGAGAQRAAR
jgi:HlyD family secretion protein